MKINQQITVILMTKNSLNGLLSMHQLKEGSPRVQRITVKTVLLSKFSSRFPYKIDRASDENNETDHTRKSLTKHQILLTSTVMKYIESNKENLYFDIRALYTYRVFLESLLYMSLRCVLDCLAVQLFSASV